MGKGRRKGRCLELLTGEHDLRCGGDEGGNPARRGVES